MSEAPASVQAPQPEGTVPREGNQRKFVDSLRHVTPKDKEKISRLTQLFTGLLDRSGISAMNPESLNIVLLGASQKEVISSVIVAKALGFPRIEITAISDKSLFSIEDLKRDLPREKRSIFQLIRRQDPYKNVKQVDANTLRIGGSTIRLVRGDAANPDHKKLPEADATMAFVGNCQVDMGGVLKNWVTFGQETDNPFLFAVTTTDIPAEEVVVENFFNNIIGNGNLTPIAGMHGIPNPYAFPKEQGQEFNMNHNLLLAAKRLPAVSK